MTKEFWERKQRNIEKRMIENAKIETLTEDQHAALETVCRMRHKLHTSQKEMFIGNAPEIERYVDCSTSDSCEMNDILTESGLKPIDFNIDFVELPCEEDYFLLDDDEREQYDGLIDWIEKNKCFWYLLRCD